MRKPFDPSRGKNVRWKRIRRISAVLLTLLLLIPSLSALALNPYDIDNKFIDYCADVIPNVRWSRSIHKDSISISISTGKIGLLFVWNRARNTSWNE